MVGIGIFIFGMIEMQNIQKDIGDVMWVNYCINNDCPTYPFFILATGAVVFFVGMFALLKRFVLWLKSLESADVNPA